jgi:hypothetical protein
MQFRPPAEAHGGDMTAQPRIPSGVDFDWQGFDEMDQVAGEGWVELLEDGSLIGEFAYHNDAESELRAIPC